MKPIHKILSLSALLLALMFQSCDLKYDLPPLKSDHFELPAGAKTITIQELRKMYASATQDNPAPIGDYWLKAVVAGDDRSGNIYKQLIVEDNTGGISVSVDQNSLYTYYAVGQEVYLKLKGLCVSVYGDEQQIGELSGKLYRAPFEIFKEHIFKNGFPDPANVPVKTFSDLSKLNDDIEGNKFTLVKFEGVHFKEGGQVNFAEPKGFGIRELIDKYGNSIVVRTSNYAKFAAEKLPVGTGNVMGILGRFRGNWQLTIRSMEDVQDFDGVPVSGGQVTPPSPVKPEPPKTDEVVIFKETLGSEPVKKDGRYYPYVSKFQGWTSGMTFEDVNKSMSVRNWSKLNCIWFPKGKNNDLKITGFNTAGYKSLKLTYKLNANLYNAGDQMDLSAMTGTFNGTPFVTPSKIVSNPKDKNDYTLCAVALPADKGNAASEIHFLTGDANTMGLRLTEITLVGVK